MVNISVADCTDMRVLHIMNYYVRLFAALNTERDDRAVSRTMTKIYEEELFALPIALIINY